MKNSIKLMTYSLCILLCSVSCSSKTEAIEETKFNIGQVWVYDSDKDPFKDVRRDTMTIVDIRTGYIQYELNGRLLSSSERMFEIGSRRIK